MAATAADSGCLISSDNAVVAAAAAAAVGVVVSAGRMWGRRFKGHQVEVASGSSCSSSGSSSCSSSSSSSNRSSSKQFVIAVACLPVFKSIDLSSVCVWLFPVRHAHKKR